MKWIYLSLLILLIGCNVQSEVDINGVLKNDSFEELNTSYRNNNTLNVTEDLSLDIVDTNEESNFTDSVHAVANVKNKLTIELVGVNYKENKCGIRVNDKVIWIDEGDREFVEGISIRVFDAFLIHKNYNAGVCEVMIGGRIFELT